MASGLQQAQPGPTAAPCPWVPQFPWVPLVPCSCGGSTGPREPAEGNRPLPGRHRVDKALLCPSMPHCVPGSEVAGPGCPWAGGHCWAGESGLWQARTRLSYPVGTLPLPHQPKKAPLACPQVGWGETPLGHLCKCCQGGDQLHPTSVGHSSWPYSTAPCLSFPSAGWQRGCLVSSARIGMGGDNTARGSALAPKVLPRWPGSNVTWP